MITIVTFKWEPLINQKEFIPTQIGNNKVTYNAHHVLTHYSMIKRNLHIPFRYLLITDQKVELPDYIEQKTLWDYHRIEGGCYHRLYTFSKEFKEYVGDRFIAMDLDMVITGDITPLLDRTEDFVYYRMYNKNEPFMNNGLYMMTTGARSFVWDEFDNNTLELIGTRKRPGTDQAITNQLLNLQNEASWDQGEMIFDMRGDFIAKNINTVPDECRIVMWPGPRDPNQPQWKAKYPWIEKHYR